MMDRWWVGFWTRCDVDVENEQQSQEVCPSYARSCVQLVLILTEVESQYWPRRRKDRLIPPKHPEDPESITNGGDRSVRGPRVSRMHMLLVTRPLRPPGDSGVERLVEAHESELSW